MYEGRFDTYGTRAHMRRHYGYSPERDASQAGTLNVPLEGRDAAREKKTREGAHCPKKSKRGDQKTGCFSLPRL